MTTMTMTSNTGMELQLQSHSHPDLCASCLRLCLCSATCDSERWMMGHFEQRYRTLTHTRVREPLWLQGWGYRTCAATDPLRSLRMIS